MLHNIQQVDISSFVALFLQKLLKHFVWYGVVVARACLLGLDLHFVITSLLHIFGIGGINWGAEITLYFLGASDTLFLEIHNTLIILFSPAARQSLLLLCLIASITSSSPLKWLLATTLLYGVVTSRKRHEEKI